MAEPGSSSDEAGSGVLLGWQPDSYYEAPPAPPPSDAAPSRRQASPAGLLAHAPSPAATPPTPSRPCPSTALVSFGMGFAILGAVSASVGLLLIKSGGQLEADLPWYRRRRWLLGFLMQAGVSALTDTVAYSVCPLSLISPLAGLTIAFSALWAMLGVVRGIHETTNCAELSTIGDTSSAVLATSYRPLIPLRRL